MTVETDVLIIGSGFSGLCTAIKLKEAGQEDFVVLERASDVGGTWQANTYPDCGCDVPSHLYSYSFAPNPTWTQTYSRQPEIFAYLQKVATDFGVRPFVRLEHQVTSVTWDDDAERWDVETTKGPFRARIVIAGAGPLAEPHIPDLPGLDSFAGETFHSARWNHLFDLRGKRVASIGTGASAIQYVPAIQPEVEQLHVFQRTPPWIMPHTNRAISRAERRLYGRFPALQRLVRGGIYVGREQLVYGFAKNPRAMKLVEKIARAHIRRSIPDPDLRSKVTPSYTIGCKRILPSNKWYRALTEPNVELITCGVKEVRANSVVAEDGTEHPVDAIIFGTGFEVTDMPLAKLVRGRDGKTMYETWAGSMNAHLGTAVRGFPNFFLLLGPNTGLGHSSMVYMIESQVAFVVDALRQVRERGASTVEVRPETVEEFNRRIDAQLQGTVWNTGCSSWYLDDTGRNATLWPDWTFRFRRRTARFDPSEYELRTTEPRDLKSAT